MIGPGKGYWINVSQAGSVRIDASSGSASSAPGPGEGSSSIASLNRIELAAASGDRQKLYFGEAGPDGSGREGAPPGFPGETFRARFRRTAGSGESAGTPAGSLVAGVRNGTNEEIPISIEGASFPLRLSWNMSSGEAALSGNGGFYQVLAGEGTVELAESDLIPDPIHGSVLRLTVGGTGPGPVPESFSVGQNYPNPFNGTTVISFSLPEDASAAVEVYDLLGERVISPGAREYGAGVHYVTIDADALPSGVYFYRVSAASAGRTFRSGTMKFILLK